ncbi:MAG: TerC family protein [Archangium sp.]|nr:TerC family protein [Archangium sp.]MDP3572993.1 TerC family protein [Archangium sp.]
MLELFTQPATWTALVSLTAMEVVLGLDNLVFISILTGKLPPHQRKLVTRIGVGGALVLRIGLLFTISWIMKLSYVLVHVGDHPFTARHLILLLGGLFLMFKATTEIHKKVEHKEEHDGPKKQSGSSFGAIVQIIAIDLVFSIDSVITAVGMVEDVPVMVVAMVVAVISMMLFAGRIGGFVERHPSMKILALSFLLLIGALLVAESLGQHVSKGYIYFAMAFSVVVELLNLRFRSKDKVEAEPAT